MLKSVHDKTVYVTTVQVCCFTIRTIFSPNSEPDGDYGYLESRLTLETFLQGCAGKVTVLVGEAGSGKTLLMSCLGQQWANGQVSLSSSLFHQYYKRLICISNDVCV